MTMPFIIEVPVLWCRDFAFISVMTMQHEMLAGNLLLLLYVYCVTC